MPKLFYILLAWGFATVSVAEDPAALYVLSATDESAVASVIRHYEELNPQVKIIYQEYNTNELYQLIMKNRNNPDFRADVVISSAMDLQVKLVNEGLAYGFSSSQTAHLPDSAQWRGELYGFTFEPAVLAYNKQAYSAQELPTSHAELSAYIRQHQAQLSGKIGTYDIKLSGVGYLFATQDAVQNSQIVSLIQNFGQAKTQVYCCTQNILSRIASGELLLGYNVIGSYALSNALADDRIGIHFLTDYTLVMARTAFVYKHSPARVLASNFIDFLLSQKGQSVIAEDSALIPIKSEVNSLLTPYITQSSFISIKLGTGLLTYLDQLKKQYFLANWASLMEQ